MSSGFQVGDLVLVRSLKRTGRIVERLGQSSYRVSLGSLTIKLAEAEIEAVAENATKAPITLISPVNKRRTSVHSSLDLHGLTVDAAVRRLESWLNDAIVAGLSQVRVVHGLGSGRLLEATHETLKRYSAVRAFRINDANPGVTDVYIG